MRSTQDNGRDPQRVHHLQVRPVRQQGAPNEACPGRGSPSFAVSAEGRAMRPIPPIRNAVLAASLFTAVSARATDCQSLQNPVYVVGSSAAKTLLAELAKILVGQASPTTIVYLGSGSCSGVDAILNGTPIVGSGTTAPSFWDNTGTESKCDILPEAGPITADIGVSDVYASTCVKLSGGLPTSV